MSKNMRETKFRSFIRTMPPLRHSVPGEKFNIEKSQVVAWLVNQPEVLQWMFDAIRESGRIKFDAESGLWSGVQSPDVSSVQSMDIE
jgi:hypothetical protein